MTDRIEKLTAMNIELYERAEKWRKALEEIRSINNDPIIEIMIRSHLNT